jgi:hypothetical protein
MLRLRWNVSDNIFQRQWKLFTSQCADNQCSFDYSFFSQHHHRQNEKSSVIFEGLSKKFHSS